MPVKDTAKLDAAIFGAVKQLRRSERGQQVLTDLKALLDNGGYGLDSENMTALCILVESVRVGQTDTVSEALDRLKGGAS